MSERVFVLDSGSAPAKEIFEKYDNVEVMGMRIFLDGQSFIDGVDIGFDEYYSRIESVNDFNTNPPLVFEIKKKYKEVISIHVSSKMSKLIQTCMNARNLVTGLDIKIIDTENMSMGSFLVAEKVIELFKAGKTYEEVMQLMPEIRRSTHINVSLSTLKYLIKNKRVGRAQGLIGNLFRMKPILGMDDEGFLSAVSRERGKENILNKLTDNAVNFIQTRRHNVKIYIMYGLQKNKPHIDAAFQMLEQKLKRLHIRDYRVIRGRIWPTVACLSGPEAYGLAVYGEENPIG